MVITTDCLMFLIEKKLINLLSVGLYTKFTQQIEKNIYISKLKFLNFQSYG